MNLNGNTKALDLLKGRIYMPDAIRGKDAFELAVMEGFKGTKEEWLESLRGAHVTEVEVNFLGSTDEDAEVVESYVTPQMFGAKGDGVTDDTQAFKNMLKAAHERSPIKSGWRAPIGVKIPSGIYLITDTLFDSNVALSRFTVQGEGMHSSRIVYLGSNPMIDASGNDLGFITFKDMNFKGSDANTLLTMYGSGQAQSFYFDTCLISHFVTIMECSGTAGCSENTFTNCKIVSCGTASIPCELFKMKNPQAVNVRFVCTDIESVTGVVFAYYNGGSVSLYQGSVILLEDSTFISIPKSANPDHFGATNAPHMTLYATRFELRKAKLIEKINDDASFKLMANDVGCGGANLGGVIPLYIAGAGTFVFTNCYNMTNYTCFVTANCGKKPVLQMRFNGCDVKKEYFLENLQKSITTESNVRKLWAEFDGIRHNLIKAVDHNGRNFKKMSLTPSQDNTALNVGVSMGVESKPTQRTTYVNNYVKQVNVINLGDNAVYGNITYTVNIKDGDGTLLGSTSFAYNEVGEKTINIYKVVKYITVEMCTSHTATVYAHFETEAVVLG